MNLFVIVTAAAPQGPSLSSVSRRHTRALAAIQSSCNMQSSQLYYRQAGSSLVFAERAATAPPDRLGDDGVRVGSSPFSGRGALESYMGVPAFFLVLCTAKEVNELLKGPHPTGTSPDL